MVRLNKKEETILTYIKTFIKEHQYPPTIREICVGVGLKSTSSVSEHIVHMKNKGVIKYEPESPRTIRIILNTDEEVEEYKWEYGCGPSIKTVIIPMWMESYAYDKKWDLSELLKEAIQNKINGE